MAPRLTLHFALQRWVAAAEAGQAAAGAECYRGLQLPRVLAAWRSFVARQAQLRRLGSRLRASCCRRARAAAFGAWRMHVTRAAAHRVACEAARCRSSTRLQAAVLAAWFSWAQQRAGRRFRAQVAADWHSTRLLAAALLAWHRHQWGRKVSAGWRRHWLLRAAVLAWLAHARHKAAMVLRWRQAVRWVAG